jgi:hypothetical protein
MNMTKLAVFEHWSKGGHAEGLNMKKTIHYPPPKRIIAALLLAVAVVCTQIPVATPGSAAMVRLNLKTVSQINAEASSYDNAIRELNAITVSTLVNAKTTEEILEKHAPKLKFGRTKLLALALSDSTFVSAVKAKAFDKQSAEKFVAELALDSNAIFKVSGASALRDRLRSAVSADVQKLQRLAKLFKENEETLRRAGTGGIPAAITVSVAALAAISIVAVAAAAAVLSSPYFAAALTAAAAPVITAGAIVTAGAAGAIAAGAAALVAAVTTSAGAAADEAQDKVAECEDRADRRYRRCKNKAHELFGPAVAVAVEACKAEWLYALGECLVTE